MTADPARITGRRLRTRTVLALLDVFLALFAAALLAWLLISAVLALLLMCVALVVAALVARS